MRNKVLIFFLFVTSFFCSSCGKNEKPCKGKTIISNNTEYRTVNCDLKNETISFKKDSVLVNEKSFLNLTKIEFRASGDLENFYFFSGSNAMPNTNHYEIVKGDNTFTTITDKYISFFYRGESNVKLSNLKITFESQILEESLLPKLSITTEKDSKGKHKKITSNTDYTNSTIDFSNGEEHFEGKQAGVRVRGNSTATTDKKPYRIKFDEKTSLFGLTAAKNWVLLAEYFDGSGIRNSLAHSITKLLENWRFSFSTHFVDLYINDTYQGFYTFCENPDEKEGRLDISKKIKSDTELDKINFLLEQDFRASQKGSGEILNKTYFVVNNVNYLIKYPEIDEFPDYNEETGTSAKFNEFVEYLKSYIKNVDDAFKSNDSAQILNYVDKDSLFNYALIDLLMCELDHGQTSFKFYKIKGEKLMMGPIWDYDSCALGFPWTGYPAYKPFAEEKSPLMNEFSISNSWLNHCTTSEGLKTDFLTFVKEFIIKNKANILLKVDELFNQISLNIIKNSDLYFNSDVLYPIENIIWAKEYFNYRFDLLLNYEF